MTQLTSRVADLQTIIEENGGTFSYKVTSDCTHLVATQKEFDAKTSKGECSQSSLRLQA